MTAGELGYGLTRAADELGRSLQAFEGALERLERSLDTSDREPVSAALDAAVPALVAAAREWHAARHRVAVYERLAADRIGYLDEQLSVRRWCDPYTLGLTARVRRRRLSARLGEYREAVGRDASERSALAGREVAVYARVRELLRRVEEARLAEEVRRTEEMWRQVEEARLAAGEPVRSGLSVRLGNTLRGLGSLADTHKRTLARAAFALACVSLGLPLDPVALLTAGLGAFV